jgi:hypothetical protein
MGKTLKMVFERRNRFGTWEALDMDYVPTAYVDFRVHALQQDYNLMKALQHLAFRRPVPTDASLEARHLARVSWWEDDPDPPYVSHATLWEIIHFDWGALVDGHKAARLASLAGDFLLYVVPELERYVHDPMHVH